MLCLHSIIALQASRRPPLSRRPLHYFFKVSQKVEELHEEEEDAEEEQEEAEEEEMRDDYVRLHEYFETEGQKEAKDYIAY